MPGSPPKYQSKTKIGKPTLHNPSANPIRFKEVADMLGMEARERFPKRFMVNEVRK